MNHAILLKLITKFIESFKISLFRVEKLFVTVINKFSINKVTKFSPIVVMKKMKTIINIL